MNKGLMAETLLLPSVQETTHLVILQNKLFKISKIIINHLLNIILFPHRYDNIEQKPFFFLLYKNLRWYKGIVKGNPLTLKSVKIGGVYLDFNTLQGLAR